MPHASWRDEDDRVRRKSKIMVKRNIKRNPAGHLSSGRSLDNHHSHQGAFKPSARISKFLDHIKLNTSKVLPLNVLIIPAVLLTGCSFNGSAEGLSGMTESFQSIKTLFETLNETAQQDLSHPINDMKQLMTWIYKTISMVVYTPVFLFDNEFFHHLIRIFTSLSIGVITVGSMIEGFKRVLGLSGTPIKKIMTRLPIMVAICGFAPFGFIKAIEAMNGITRFIFNIGTNLLESTASYSNQWALISFGDIFETIGFLLFIILYVALLIPMMLYHGQRWFSMIALGILTPFAMLGYVFDSFESLHTSWWTSLKGLFLVQIVYSIFVTILSILMFAVPFPATMEGMFAKLLVILGGLYMLAVPPPFVKKFFDKGTKPNKAYTVAAKKIGNLMLKKF